MLWDSNQKYAFIWWVRHEAVRLQLSFRDALLRIIADPAQAVHRNRVMISHSDGSGASTGYTLPTGRSTSDVLNLVGELLRLYDRTERHLGLAEVEDIQQPAILDEMLAMVDQPVREVTNDYSLLGYYR